MKFCLLVLFLFTSFQSLSQTYTISGKVVNEENTPLKAIELTITNHKDSTKSTTDKEGNFLIKTIATGFWYLTIIAHGYEGYADSFQVSNANINLGQIRLQHVVHELDAVKIVEKVLAMVQKDDTLEFNSGAYKVNPDADAADLIKKMPSIEINDKQVTAQGETVTKIVVDGKPFFGNDPYASLKNLPADIIDKVQVYNEKSDQEKFTGFSEGNTTKTINIITKPGKRNGTFGKIYGGCGSDNSNDSKYGAGISLNQFGGDRRITVTGQSNNVNIQNFTNDNAIAPGGGGAGTANTNAGGINYSDKLGKKTDITLSYFFNEVNNSVSRDTRKTYLLSVDSGQVYNETNPSTNQNYGHRINTRLNYTFDTMNSIVLQPNIAFTKANNNSQRYGNTEEAALPVNQTTNNNLANTAGLNFSNNLLFRHRFRKKGRTFSLSVNTNDNNNNGTTLHSAQNVYYSSPSLNDTLKQQTLQKQNTWNLTGNATYTEPSGKNGLLKLEYNIAYMPAISNRNTSDYSDASGAYSLPDSMYSNSFLSKNISHKAGGSYLIHSDKAELSFGLNYQLTELGNEQTLPFQYALHQDFQNLLPTATFHYKFSKTKNLQCTYNTNTQVPSVSQLQNVVNNTDPLHLYTGNPDLKQPYQHNLTIRYNATSKNAKNNFSVSITGALTQHYITTNSIIAQNDTTIGQNIVLARGSQLTMPENIDGYGSLTSNISYGLPLEFIKCHLNFSINAGLSRAPAIINNQANEQHNKNGGLGVSVGSNISENVDFTFSSNANVVSNANSINKQLSTNYFNENSKASLNVIIWKGIVFNTALNYTANSGLSTGYNQNYLLWNLSLGKKLFKKHQGDLRLSVFDILNDNNNIHHSITDTYIQDTRTNILQRYFLIVFSYKISNFKK